MIRFNINSDVIYCKQEKIIFFYNLFYRIAYLVIIIFISCVFYLKITIDIWHIEYMNIYKSD